MEIFQTNATLGHQQLAFIVRLDKTKNGHDYLIIGEQYLTGEYGLGEVIKDLEDLYVEESSFTIEESPLHGTFLFDSFVKSQTLEYKGDIKNFPTEVVEKCLNIK